MPATNGLLENTDSHASQSGELGRIWSKAEGRVVSERKTHKGKSSSKGKVNPEVPLKHYKKKKEWERKSPKSYGSCNQ